MDLHDLIGLDASSDVVPTGAVRKMTVGGREQNYNVYRIRLSRLRYNVQNDRIATWVSEYRAEHGVDAFDALGPEEFNDVIDDFIYQSNPGALKKTMGNIKLNGQREPGVVLADGLVVDGNRRFTCLRHLAKEDERFGWFEAVILEPSVGNDPTIVKKLELTIQHGEESKVSYDPIDRLVGVYNDVICEDTRILDEATYAQCANISPRDMRGLISSAQCLVQFLDFIGAPRQFHLARQLSLGSLLSELPGLLKKCSSDEQRELAQNAVYANLVVEPQGDIVRFVRDVKKCLDSDVADSFLRREQDLAAEVVDRLSSAQGTPYEKINEIRADQDLSNSFLKATMDCKAAMQTRSTSDAPKAALEKALKDLAQVQEEIFEVLPEIELPAIQDAYEKVRTRLDVIGGALDAARKRG